MEGDALSLALEQPNEEDQPVCEVLPPSPDAADKEDEDDVRVPSLNYYSRWRLREPNVTRDDNAPVGAGLRNLGNTCFLNAVLQCLTYTSPLVSCLRNTSHKIPCVHEGFCAFCALRDHVNEVLSSYGGVIEPSQLFDNLCNLSSSASFQKYQQEDAHEYMQCLLEALHKSTLSPQEAKACLLLQGDSFVKSIFGGRLRSQIRCVECSHCSDSFEPLIDLSLEINNSSSVTEALESFTAVESIECDEKYQCEKCKLGKSVRKQLTIDRAPEVLAIQLKRFLNTGIIGTKVTKEVSYPQILDLKPFVNSEGENQGNLNYELYGVLVHSGWTMNYGHYFSFVQTSPDVWHKLDDWQVRNVDKETVFQQQAYILFYFRQGTQWFPGPVEEIMKHMSVESPKSVLDDSNVNNDSDSVTDKESHRSTSDGEKQPDEEFHGTPGTKKEPAEESHRTYNREKEPEEELYRIPSNGGKVPEKKNEDATTVCLREITKTSKESCEANGLPSTIDMPGNAFCVSPSGRTQATMKPFSSSSSPSIEERPTEKSPFFLGEKTTTSCLFMSSREGPSAAPVTDICKTPQDEGTSKHARKMLLEGGENIPKSSKKVKRQQHEEMPISSSRTRTHGNAEMPKPSTKSGFDNKVNSNIKCSQGTPNSINKVLNHMPSSRRASLIQFVQPNNFQTPKKETTPSHSGKKRMSPTKCSVGDKRQKQSGNRNSSSSRARSDTAGGSLKNPSQTCQWKQENFITLENDPYDFEDEIEQIPRYGCSLSKVGSNDKVDMSSLYSLPESKKTQSHKTNMQKSKHLKEEIVISPAKHRVFATEAVDGLSGIKTCPSITISTV